VLTGFKWIAELIKEKEEKENYIIGGEESYGLMVGSKIRDKDAVSAVAILCEMAAYERSRGKTLFEKLLELYVQHGFYLEHLISITKKGRDGQQQIADMMERFRAKPPITLGGVKVVQLLDYEKRENRYLSTGAVSAIELPKSNVLQFILEDGSKISARPSGTEPKIKFYFSVNAPLPDAAAFESVQQQLKSRIETIISELQL
jgi:phosphoglucomutase